MKKTPIGKIPRGGKSWPSTARAADGAGFFDHFWVSELKKVLKLNFGHFGEFPAMEKR